MLKCALWILSAGYNIKKGRGGIRVKTGDGKTYAFNKTVIFRGVSKLPLSMIVRALILSTVEFMLVV